MGPYGAGVTVPEFPPNLIFAKEHVTLFGEEYITLGSTSVHGNLLKILSQKFGDEETGYHWYKVFLKNKNPDKRDAVLYCFYNTDIGAVLVASEDFKELQPSSFS